MEGLEIETTTRAVAGEPAALIRLQITNPERTARKVEIGIRLAGRLLHTIEGWANIFPALETGWSGLDPVKDSGDPSLEKWEYDARNGCMRFSSMPKAFSAHGARPFADRVEGKTLFYDVHLQAGASWTLDFVFAMGETDQEASRRFSRLVEDFEGACQRVRRSWQEKIQASFEPGNGIFSGYLPTLHTDEEDLARLYYMSYLGSLLCRRNNPLSQYGTTYITLMPNNWTTATFLWDMMIAAPYFALLDPAVLRTMIEVWLKVDLNNGESFLFTTDTMFFKENWVNEQPPGWLVRDMRGWRVSLDKLKRIADRHNCHVILGHDKDIFDEHAKRGVIG